MVKRIVPLGFLIEKMSFLGLNVLFAEESSSQTVPSTQHLGESNEKQE
jgi:hypothetical protein